MIPFTGKQLQLIQLLMEQSTPIALDEISQLLHAGRRSVYYIVNKTFSAGPDICLRDHLTI